MDADRYTRSVFGEARHTLGRGGYVAYFPRSIPRRLELPSSTVRLLADAESSLGRLVGVGQLLPNPDLLIRPYLLREALASTRIEGTRATMAEVFEVDAAGESGNADVEEVLNYIAALNWGLEQLETLPISARLIREIHAQLMAGVRGRDRTPGEFRTSQNWIGAANSTIETADFVPPPPEELPALMTDWERFANEDPDMPLLIQDALLHAQFETIHPFLDGNGRLGRLLLVFFLIARERLSAPLLYLSAYLERERPGYFYALHTIQATGDPAPWLELFLTAVDVEARDAVGRAAQIVELQALYRDAAATMGTANSLALVDLIFEHPVVTTRLVEERLGVSRPTALRLLRGLEARGVLAEGVVGVRGQRRYVARELMVVVTGEHEQPPS
ncbi:MAG: Fic family protein [Solirubrobacteraceae bacterium]